MKGRSVLQPEEMINMVRAHALAVFLWRENWKNCRAI